MLQVVWGDIDSSVTAAEEAYLKNTLVPAAVEYWEEALEVGPSHSVSLGAFLQREPDM